MSQGVPSEHRPAEISAEAAAALAERHGLTRNGIRPRFGAYLRDLWRQRRFLWTLSAAESYARNQDNYLGQLWAVLNPLLLAGAYYLIFGLLLGVDGGVDNYVGFLVIGLFLFIYSSGNLTAGSRAITGNLGLVRSLRFPRAVLPLSVTLTEFLAVLPTLGVLLALVLITGETPTASWLLFPVAILLLLLINAGIALLVARMVHSSRDLRNLMPLVVRLLRYVSGVFFSIEHYVDDLTGIVVLDRLIAIVMQYQPFALALDIARQALLAEFSLSLTSWLVAAGWALLLPVAGMTYFWRAEATYGRN
ncbi:ABC transporter permease [Georgenia sp. 10Sc9-8]|uniref:Transport permease protein n=1 Tax=Georgenia halotolerans TaxID=3028317 RepID=A0ABT5TV47_9MICO|nr:ABC transporter permease [Georgenia halotolerans]